MLAQHCYTSKHLVEIHGMVRCWPNVGPTVHYQQIEITCFTYVGPTLARRFHANKAINVL